VSVKDVKKGDARDPNAEVETIEIEKAKGLTAIAGQGRSAGSVYPERQKASWQNAHRNPPRNKGRRTMGRGGR
jgi:hypothetical protein